MYGLYDHSWMFGGGMLLGVLWMILIWSIPLLLLFALLKYLFAKSEGRNRTPPPQEPATPLEVLQLAYARGDISREEYLQKRDDLQDKG
jgi:putative membrane protein